jgi:hypothetical protein
MSYTPSPVRSAALRSAALNLEGLLDGVEVWAVGRQVDELSALCSDRLGNAGRLVARQIVEHDNVLPPQGRGQHLLDMSAETLAVDGAVEDAARGDPSGA